MTDDTASAVKESKGGRIEYRADRGACVHAPVGKLSFQDQALIENVHALMTAIQRARPASAKGTYLVSCTISSTMSPGVKLDTRQFARS